MYQYLKAVLCALVAAVALWACVGEEPQPRPANYIDTKTFYVFDTYDGDPFDSFHSERIRFEYPNFVWKSETKETYQESNGNLVTLHSRIVLHGRYTYDQGKVSLSFNDKAATKEDLITKQQTPLDEETLTIFKKAVLTADEQKNTLTFYSPVERRTLFLKLLEKSPELPKQ